MVTSTFCGFSEASAPAAPDGGERKDANADH
jgi:hypothetical protein